MLAIILLAILSGALLSLSIIYTIVNKDHWTNSKVGLVILFWLLFVISLAFNFGSILAFDFQLIG